MKKRRIIAGVLATLMITCSASLLSCKKKGESGTIPGGESSVETRYNVPGEDKMTILVKNFGMGPGNVWLEETAERFAEANLNTTYGDKTGVYIKITETSEQNTAAMASDSTNIFFDERASDPYVLNQNELLLNIDSIVKDESRVGGSLESKIFDSAKGGISENGSYFALPHYEFYTGIVYNRATFTSLNAYFAADDETDVYQHNSKYGKAKFIGSASATKSVGPDGKAGNDDDGLPRSLDEFIILCDYIKVESEGSIYPLTVSGKYFKDYPDYLLIGLWTALAGAEQMRNYYNCTGEIEIVERDSNGNILFEEGNLFSGINYVKKPKTKKYIMAADGSEGWMGNDMAAKYYALAMLDVIINEGFFSPTASSETNHWDTQMDLYMDGKGTTHNSAMLVEGSYWYNESDEKGGFKLYETVVGKNRKDLDVAWMSLPTSVYAQNAVGRDACFLDCGLAYTMINKNVEKNPALKQACLDFVAFCYSEQELQNFTLKTGITRAISYDLTPEQKQNMSVYARRLWDARDNVNGSNIVAWSGDTETFKEAKTVLKLMLNCGVLGNGTEKASYLFSKHHTDVVFDECSLYGDWQF